MTPDVSVVVPTRDRWPLLASRAVESALGQQDVRVEVIVVDDGSTSSPRRVGRLCDPRVRIVRRERPAGVAAARNAGIGEARGEWIAFLDDDDLWAPHKLRAQLSALALDGGAFAYGGAVWVDEELRVIEGHAPPESATLARELLRWNVLWGGASNVLASADLVRSLGGFDERLFQLADWDLWIRLAAASKGLSIGDVLVALVVHPESMLVVDRRDVFEEFALLDDKHGDAARAVGVRLDSHAFARWVAGGHLRAGRRVAAARALARRPSPGNVARAVGALVAPTLLARASKIRSVIPGALPAGQRVLERPGWLDRYR